MMLRVLRFQAEITELVKPAAGTPGWPVAHEDELGEIGAGEALEAGTEPGPLAEAVRRGHARAERALARHRDSREAMETQEGFDEAAHAMTAERLAAAVEERTRLPVRFGPPPEPANDLPPADDPPGEAYEDCPWADEGGFGDDDRTDGTIDDDRADGAEHDWLYQRRNGYDDIYDPWARRNASSGSGTGSNGTNGAMAATPSTPTMRTGTTTRMTRTGRRTANSPRS